MTKRCSTRWQRCERPSRNNSDDAVMSLPAAVIFDNDGLTLDSEELWTQSEQKLFAAHGIEFNDEHKIALLGNSGPHAATILARELGRPDEEGPALVEEMNRLVYVALESGCEPMPAFRLRSAPTRHGRSSTVRSPPQRLSTSLARSSRPRMSPTANRRQTRTLRPRAGSALTRPAASRLKTHRPVLPAPPRPG